MHTNSKNTYYKHSTTGALMEHVCSEKVTKYSIEIIDEYYLNGHNTCAYVFFELLGGSLKIKNTKYKRELKYKLTKLQNHDV